MEPRGTTPAGEPEHSLSALERLLREFEASYGLDISPCPEGEARATALLRTYMTENEWAQLTSDGCVDVASPSVPGRYYRIPRNGGMVTLYQRSRPVVRLCAGPAEALPRDDVVLLHMVCIRGDEQGYLETANPFPPHAHPMRPRTRSRA